MSASFRYQRMPHHAWIDTQWPLASQPSPAQRAADGDVGNVHVCAACSKPVARALFAANAHVCPRCDHHGRMRAADWFLHMTGDAPCQWLGEAVTPRDVLGFVDSKPYTERLAAAKASSGQSESLRCGYTRMQGMPVVLAVFEFGFIGGTLGEVAGQRFALGVQKAIEMQCPFVCVTASGGARMQEGMLALCQMAKVSLATATLAQHGLPYITVLADPTTGGVAASLAMQADIIIAEQGALIGFTGPRVIKQTIKKDLPEGFQRAESLLALGAVDRVAHRKNIPTLVHGLLTTLMHSRMASHTRVAEPEQARLHAEAGA